MPDPTTIAVLVDRDGIPIALEEAAFDCEGGQLSGDWVYDAESNEVAFTEFVPAIDDVVEITYDPAP